MLVFHAPRTPSHSEKGSVVIPSDINADPYEGVFDDLDIRTK